MVLALGLLAPGRRLGSERIGGWPITDVADRRDDLENAVRRGKARDNPPCVGWPKRGGVTTAYKLVENMLNCPPTS